MNARRWVLLPWPVLCLGACGGGSNGAGAAIGTSSSNGSDPADGGAATNETATTTTGATATETVDTEPGTTTSEGASAAPTSGTTSGATGTSSSPTTGSTTMTPTAGTATATTATGSATTTAEGSSESGAATATSGSTWATSTSSSTSAGSEASTDSGTSSGSSSDSGSLSEPVVCDNGGSGASYLFRRQEHVDLYPAGCEVLAVGLVLESVASGDGTGDIVDLSALAGLVEVQGHLAVRTRWLETLDGLDDLRRVDGDLIVGLTERLTDVTALHGTSVGGDVYVQHNYGLCQDRVWDLTSALFDNGIGGGILATTPNWGECP